MSLASRVRSIRTAWFEAAGRFASDRFLRTLGTIGAAQMVVRVSRLASTVILSRALDPESFGLAAIVLTVYELVALFTRNGVSAKVVQASPEAADRVAQTAYWMTWAICLGLMVVQATLALPVAWIYHESRLAAPIALMSLIYLATPLSNIQGAFIQRDGRVSRIALAGAVQVTVDNALTAAFALGGLGMWAILWPKLLVAPIWVYFLRYGHSWRAKPFPGFAKAFEGWRDIARFSRSVMGVELLTTLQANVDNLLVGYFLGVVALGIYAFAFNAGLGITLGLVTAFGTAVYPHLCELRADPEALGERFRRTRRTVALITTPIVLLQTFSAPIYVPLVFGQKWAAAVPTLMVICLSALARPYASMASQLLKAVGRPDIEFRWQALTTAFLIVALAVAAQFGVFEVGLAVLLVQTTMASSFAFLAPRRVLARLAPHDSRGRKVTFDVARSETEMFALQAEWDTLSARAVRPYRSQGFAWCQAGWTTTARPVGKSLYVATLRADGELVLVWPLAVSRRWLWTLASPLGSDSTEYDALLVEAGPDAEHYVALAHDFVRRESGIDVVGVRLIEQDSPRAKVLTRIGLARRAEILPAPYLDHARWSGWDDYWKSRSSKLRTNINRHRRALAKLGVVAVGFAADADAFGRALDKALQFKREWMRKRKLETAFLRSAEYRDFLASLGRRDLVAMTLSINHEIVAVKIGALDGARFEGFITAYDVAFEAASPGVVLLADCVLWCFERRLDYDFRIGEESYKAHWTDVARTLVSVRFATSVRGALWLAAEAADERRRSAVARLRAKAPAWLRALAPTIRTMLSGTRRGPAASGALALAASAPNPSSLEV